MNSVRSKDGTTIAFDWLGEGPPIILAGGAFSYRAFPKLVQLAELLAPGFTVINYDRRGRVIARTPRRTQSSARSRIFRTSTGW